MDIIKKRINLEQFKSRIPGLINVVDKDYKLDNKVIDLNLFLKNNASWGKIPVSINILGKTLKYGTIMNLYYKLLDTIIGSVYYIYNKKNRKWITKDIDWRDIIKRKQNVTYLNYIPTTYETNNIIGITSDENIHYFYNIIKFLYEDNYDAFDFVDKVNQIIGREIIPYFYECKNCGKIDILDNKLCNNCGSEDLIEIQEPYVPYFIYLSELSDIISFMEDLKKKSLINCCEKKNYKEYGGDVFYNYLLKLKEKEIRIYNVISESPTIDITLLLTSNLHDMGMYRTYDVDIIEDDNVINNRASNNTGEQIITDSTNETIGDITGVTINNGNIVITSGESKLRTLKKRKCSVDDNGAELPGIYNKDTSKLELPYQINYIKNIRYQSDNNNNDMFYGDLIFDIKEKTDSIEVTESYYSDLISMLDIKQHMEGTIIEPINTIQISDVKPDIINFSDDTYDKVYEKFLADINEREILLRNKLLKLIRNNYPTFCCLKQDYEFIYNISYNDKITKTVLNNEKIIKQGSIYVAFDNPTIEFIYVLGGRLKKITNINTGDSKLVLDENNPFNLNSLSLKEWDGNGIWYKEEFPVKKFCVNDFIIDNKIETLTYDVIDFENKETILNYEGIDFPRNKYILCENIMYKPENYKKYATNDVYFKDEKITSVSFPLNEIYNVVIDRGNNAAFEKHLQLSEIKTWEDLEKYRNGMFLNK